MILRGHTVTQTSLYVDPCKVWPSPGCLNPPCPMPTLSNGLSTQGEETAGVSCYSYVFFFLKDLFIFILHV